MSTAAWIMLVTTWTVIIAFTVRFYVRALARPSHDSDD
jgi:hypothetical protein